MHWDPNGHGATAYSVTAPLLFSITGVPMLATVSSPPARPRIFYVHKRNAIVILVALGLTPVHLDACLVQHVYNNFKIWDKSGMDHSSQDLAADKRAAIEKRLQNEDDDIVQPNVETDRK